MKLLISTSASPKKLKVEKPVFAKPNSISASVEKKLIGIAKRAAKERTRTLRQLEKAVTAFKKKYPPLTEAELSKQLLKEALAKEVHPEYLDKDGSLKLAPNTTIEELVENCNLELPAEFYGDTFQEVYDTFRDYF